MRTKVRMFAEIDYATDVADGVDYEVEVLFSFKAALLDLPVSFSAFSWHMWSKQTMFNLSVSTRANSYLIFVKECKP